MPTNRDQIKKDRKTIDELRDRNRQFRESDDYKQADDNKRQQYDRHNDALENLSQSYGDLDQD